MAEKAIAHTSRPLLADVFGGMGKVAEGSAETLFSAIVRTGSALVTDIADTIPDAITSKKGLQEKVSGWLGRYRFAERVDRRLWKEGLSLVGRDTVIAVDSGDISKEFGGAGMEGMEMGYDASRGVTAMGHSLLCAAVVCRRRAMPMRMSLRKGRKGLPDAERELFDAIADATGGNGIPVHDRGFDSEEFVGHAIRSGRRAVVRMKTMTRDLFGTGRSVEEDMATAPHVRTALRSPTRRVDATVGWRMGFFPCGDATLQVLVVSSSFRGNTLYLYAINFSGEEPSAPELRQAAILAANAYFCRWGVEVLFQDMKQCFSIEDARVRTFRRLENLLALCTLAFAYLAHVLPNAGEHARRLLKAMKDSLGEIVGCFRPFVANVRELLRMRRVKYISGRPRKRKPPDMTPMLPGFPAVATAQIPFA